jgi:hypothetical protein
MAFMLIFQSSKYEKLPDQTGNLYSIFQRFEKPDLYHLARRFCLVGHRLLGERVDAFMLSAWQACQRHSV